jgi:hypothetical protein
MDKSDPGFHGAYYGIHCKKHATAQADEIEAEMKNLGRKVAREWSH